MPRRLLICTALSALALSGCSRKGAYVLHRAGNPPDVYIARFDALDEFFNKATCEEFIGYVEKGSPETGPVRCSPAP